MPHDQDDAPLDPEKVGVLELPNDAHVIVDRDVYEDVSRHRWHLNGDEKRGAYPARVVVDRETGKRQIIRLHRYILNAPDGLEVDHINHDTRDCRRQNLRLATRVQNCANFRIRKDSRTGFKGVQKEGNRYVAAIGNTRVGRSDRLGTFATPEEAARAYDREAIERYGEFAHLNFLRSDYEAVPCQN